MVVTFNKREILEFANWNIKQERFPKQFKFTPPKGYDLTPFFDLMEERGVIYQPYERSLYQERVDKGESIVYSNITVRTGKSVNTCKSDSLAYRDIDVFLNVEEFEKCLNHEKIPLATDEDLGYWLKHEKGIEINK